MKIRWVAGCFLISAIFAPNVLAQSQQPQHAPTPEVCRADVAVWWTDHIVDEYNASGRELTNSGRYIPNPAGDLPIKEAFARLTEMQDCQNVDAPNARAYSGAWDFYNIVCMERYRRFVVRHGLLDQFFKEDAQGVR